MASAIVSLHVRAVGCAVGVSGPRRDSSDPGVIVPSVLPPSVIHSTYLRVPPRTTRVLPASRCLLSRSPPLRRIVSPSTAGRDSDHSDKLDCGRWTAHDSDLSNSGPWTRSLSLTVPTEPGVRVAASPWAWDRRQPLGWGIPVTASRSVPTLGAASGQPLG